MAQADDKKMIAEMNSFLADKNKANKSDEAKAEAQLPFESIDSYSTDPVGFEEMSLRMLSKVEFVFDLAVNENRFSSKYLKRCIQLEKGIKYLGSLCVTKYALQTQGQTFPQLGQLSTEKLYGMTSHHYRKLDQAVSEYIFEHRDLPDKLFDMEMRYFNLLERLRSTETKIRNFHLNYVYDGKGDTPIAHGLAFSEKSWTGRIHRENDEAPAFRHAPAFPATAAAGMTGGRISQTRAQHESEESDPASNTGTVSALLQSQHAGTVPMCGQLQGGSSQSDAQGDSSPVPASRQQENRPHCAPKPASRQQENRPLVLPHREQLSKAGSHGKVADALENEEGSKENKKSETLENKKSETLENKKSEIRNKKSEAQRDVSAAAASPAQQGRTIVAPGNNPVSACSDSQLPPFVKILQRVMERSRESDDGSLTFTFDEMEFLAADPLFARFEPVMAADIRRILASKPPG